MTLVWLLASLHLLGLAIGLGAIFARARALGRMSEEGALPRVLVADNFWGLSALILISTGLLRAFGGYEKGSAYYLGNTLFWIKMTLLVVVILLEIGPMIALIRWRIQLGRGNEIDTTPSSRFAKISYVQTILVVGMLLAAAAMARGLNF